MAEIAKADDWGLAAGAFALPTLPSGDLSPAALADAEIKLSLAVLEYARHARGGRLEPSQVSRNFDQKVSLRDPKVVLETVAGLETPGSYLRALHPQHPQFELLRQALLKTRAGVGQAKADADVVVQIPDGPALKLGMEHPDVSLVRERLKLAAPPGRRTCTTSRCRQRSRSSSARAARGPTACSGRARAPPSTARRKPRLRSAPTSSA